MDILISVVTKVIQCTFAPIERQVVYILNYNENMKDLEEQTQNLMNASERVKQEVDQAKGNAYKIFDDVSQWLHQVDEIITKQVGNGSSIPSCLNLIERHRLSRRAKKTVEEIKKALQRRVMLGDKVGNPAPLQGIQPCSIPDYQILESRTLTANQIKDALANPNVNKIGVYGMGGVGKSMLLHEVEELVKKEKLFDQVIIVMVRKTYDVKSIQAQIGDKLMLKLDKLERREEQI